MVPGPQEILSFLEHHFDIQAKGENQEEAIQYAYVHSPSVPAQRASTP